MCANAPTGLFASALMSETLMEIRMYIGGVLGTIILIALIVWFVRRV